jgi:hypothetical protein
MQIICLFGDQTYVEVDQDESDLADCDYDWRGMRVFRELREPDENEHYADFDYMFEDDGSSDGWGRYLWFYADDHGNPYNVAWLVHKFLERFRPQECWELSYAMTCSKPRVDAFGGGTMFVTAASIRDTEEYLIQLKEQFQKQLDDALDAKKEEQ